MSEQVATIEKSPKRRLSITRVAIGGEQRVGCFEEERHGQRWAPTRYGFTIAVELLPALIAGLQAAGEGE